MLSVDVERIVYYKTFIRSIQIYMINTNEQKSITAEL